MKNAWLKEHLTAGNPNVGAEFRLRGLDPKATYEVTNFDVEGAMTLPGSDLMEKGLAVNLKARPGAAVIVYRRDERAA